MSEHEIQKYIQQLTSQLGLKPQQQKEMAEELRSHCEDRIEELTAAGNSNDQAAEVALAEFGDVAQLAEKFNLLTRRKRRRWMVRLATASVTSGFMIIMLFASLWPDGGRIPMTPPVTAQGIQSSESDAGQPQGSSKWVESPFVIESDLETEETRNAATRVALEQETTLKLEQATIAELVSFLNETLPHGAILDTATLEDQRVEAEGMTLSWNLPRSRLATMLEILLEPWELTYRIQDGVLILTTNIAATERPATVLYDVSKLMYSELASTLGADGVNSIQEDASSGEERNDDPNSILVTKEVDPVSMRKLETMAELLRSRVEPLTWEVNGGALQIEVSGVRLAPIGNDRYIQLQSVSHRGVLMVTQTESAHRKIRKLLSDMSR